MATYAQRAIAIADAVVNKTATNEQRTRIATAFRYHEDETQSQIAERFVKEIRHYIINKIKQYESQIAIAATQETVFTQIDIDFTET